MDNHELIDNILTFDAKGIATNLHSEIIITLIGGAFWLFRKKMPSWYMISNFQKAYALSIAVIVALFFVRIDSVPSRIVAFAFGIASLGVLLHVVFSGLDKVGVTSVFLKTRQGVDFEKSLRMADGPIDFLGIGGDKLSKTSEFQEAMIRCATNGRTVRLLLMPPDNPLLGHLAKRNGADAGQYSTNVRESLRRIAKIKLQRSLDIQVKFYPLDEDRDWQIFRLMFINRNICLWSWTVWGEHLGKDNPQVILVNRDSNDQRTIFNAFQHYFERTWSDPRCKWANLDDYGA